MTAQIRTLVPILLVLAGLAHAQIFFTPFPADLKQYLNLTDAEVAFIHQATTDYSQIASTKQRRISDLQSEIDDETRKDQPDAMALGIRYVEIESIRRDMAAQLTAFPDKLRASLDDAQRSKLNALNDARNLQPVIDDAQCENLLDAGVANPFFGVLTRTVFLSGDFSFSSGCFSSPFPSELMQYLTLSTDQADTITRLNSNNQQSTNDRQQNIFRRQAQIAQETAKDTLDPLAIGTLYAQVESIRREISKDLTTLRNNARAVLNDMQRVKLTSLDDARRLQPLISEASCENLLDPQPSLFQWFDTSSFSTTLLGTVTPFCGTTVRVPFIGNP